MLMLVRYISQDSPKGAARVHEQILSMVGLLADWPDLGRQGRRRDLRELVVPRTPYIVLYRRTPAEVIVLRVVHGSQRR